MVNTKRISLMDPMLYQSSFANPNPPKPLKLNFWKKFNIYNFICNIVLPIFVLIFVLFMLKSKYLSKKHRTFQKKTSNISKKTIVKSKFERE